MGPCLCGDPYCGSCGNPSLAKLEAIKDDFMEKIHNAGLDEFEYRIVLDVGLKAVEMSRKATKNRLAEIKEDEEYSKSFKNDWIEYGGFIDGIND